MKLLGIDALLARLCEQPASPYRHLSPAVRSMLDEALRVFELRPGDRMHLATSRHPAYLSALAGTVSVSAGGVQRTLHAGETCLMSDPMAAGIALSAEEPAHVCVADSDIIDELLSLDTISAGMSQANRDILPLLERARKSPAFRRVPLECVEAALGRMGRQDVQAGQEIVKQGEPGDIFYVIAAGHAEVWQTGLYDDEPKKVAELGAGDAFGEEALVTRGTRSATVRMTSDGALLTLALADYDALISQQMIDEVEPTVAKTMLDAGYRLLDVRYVEENEDSAIPDSQLIPLPELRERAGELERDARWVVYCRSGKRSAVATLLLRQRGLQAVSLRGGINGWPYETRSAY
jgi:rhodanese-related sulfurtransferase/quercetin dioxygenase-like cupin family protein